MKCYCYETETDFVLCVENADIKLENNLLAAWFEKTDKGFIKSYPMTDKENGVDEKDKEMIKNNFARLGQSMFENMSGWEKTLLLLARKFSDNGIEWYVIGSISEAIRGVGIEPHDIDIIVHTKDFFKVKDIFPDSVVEPFVDNKGTWLVRYFGRICLGSGYIDIAADEKMNIENGQHQYEKFSWKSYEVFIEPLQLRYEVEKQRGRADRIKAIEAYMNRTE